MFNESDLRRRAIAEIGGARRCSIGLRSSTIATIEDLRCSLEAIDTDEVLRRLRCGDLSL